MKEKIIVFGAGGHAKVIIDILEKMDSFTIEGIVIKTKTKESNFQGYELFEEDEVFQRKKLKNIKNAALGIGGFKNNFFRTIIYKKIESNGFTLINTIDPSAIISKSTILGNGIVIYPGVVINTNVKLGDNVIIAAGATIDHEANVGNNVLISTAAAIGAYSIINEGALIALGAKIVAGVNIGSNVLVAAGAVVVSDIPDNQKVYGIPAKQKE